MRALEAVLEQVTISDALGILGLPAPHRSTMHCPLPEHDDRHPSAGIYDSGHRWHCYVCNTGGDVIDLVKAAQRVGTREAVEILGGKTLRTPRASPRRRGPTEADVDALLTELRLLPCEAGLENTYAYVDAEKYFLLIRLRLEMRSPTYAIKQIQEWYAWACSIIYARRKMLEHRQMRRPRRRRLAL